MARLEMVPMIFPGLELVFKAAYFSILRFSELRHHRRRNCNSHPNASRHRPQHQNPSSIPSLPDMGSVLLCTFDVDDLIPHLMCCSMWLWSVSRESAVLTEKHMENNSIEDISLCSIICNAFFPSRSIWLQEFGDHSPSSAQERG